MLAEEMWGSFSAPVIGGKMLSVGGVTVRLFDEALNQRALELAKSLVTLAGTACFFINVKPHPCYNGKCLLDDYDQISMSLTFRWGVIRSSQIKTLASNKIINSKTGLCIE